MLKYGKILSVVEYVQCATVAQLVEQLTRNEQVACSNQVSSSNVKDPEKWLAAWLFRVFLHRFYKALLRGKVRLFLHFSADGPEMVAQKVAQKFGLITRNMSEYAANKNSPMEPESPEPRGCCHAMRPFGLPPERLSSAAGLTC